MVNSSGFWRAAHCVGGPAFGHWVNELAENDGHTIHNNMIIIIITITFGYRNKSDTSGRRVCFCSYRGK